MYQPDISHLILDPKSLMVSLIVLVCILVLVQFKSYSIEDEKDRRSYRWNFYYKLFFSTVFSVYYILIFKGGDTWAYWEATNATRNLLFTDFDKFLDIVQLPPSMERFFGHFNYETGFPPRFIYMEEESFSVSKYLLIFQIITFNSYLATAFILSYFTASATWRIYTMARAANIFNISLLKIFILYLPSVSFWCSGVSKDTIVFISILYCIYFLYRIVKAESSPIKRIWSIIGLLFFSYIIYRTRPFILFPILVPLLLMFSTGLINKIKSFVMLRVVIKTFIYVGIIVGFIAAVAYFTASDMAANNDALNSAIIVQQDFQNNVEIYGGDDGKRYTLGSGDYSTIGILKMVPEAIIAGIYRPYLWEALRPSLFFNGLESMFFIFMTLWFVFVKFKDRIHAMQNNELLIFSIGFVLVIAFMAGFTSILFGVLVRIRAPLLPFLGLIFSIDIKKYKDHLATQLKLERES